MLLLLLLLYTGVRVEGVGFQVQLLGPDDIQVVALNGRCG